MKKLTHLNSKLFNKSAIIAFAGLIIISTAPAFAQSTETGAASRLSSLNLEQIYKLSETELESLLSETVIQGCPHAETDTQSDPRGLTLVEKCAIFSYSTTWFDVNKRLWETDSTGSRLSGLDWAYVRVLDLALKKIPSEKPLTVYRGTSRHKPILKNIKTGKVIRFKGYTSTSSDPEVAKWFLNGEADRLMVIKAISAKSMSGYSGTDEKELLLPRSSWLRFESSEMKFMKVFNEETGNEDRRQVEVVYFTEVPAP